MRFVRMLERRCTLREAGNAEPQAKCSWHFITRCKPGTKELWPRRRLLRTCRAGAAVSGSRNRRAGPARTEKSPPWPQFLRARLAASYEMPTALGLRFGIPCLPQRATPFEHSHKPHPEMPCVLSKVHSATIRHLEKASRKRHISPEYRSVRTDPSVYVPAASAIP